MYQYSDTIIGEQIGVDIVQSGFVLCSDLIARANTLVPHSQLSQGNGF